MKTTQDNFLNGKICIVQPAAGYRAGIDAVLLSAFIQPDEGDSILDIGAGVGTVSLCIASHFPKVKITALEIQDELVKLGLANVSSNGFDERITFLQGDLIDPPSQVVFNTFNHVVTNPPYFNFGDEARNVEQGKSLSRHIHHMNIGEWVKACLKFVKPRGYISLVYRADQLDKIITSLESKTGEIKVLPLWPTAGKSAKLVLVRARKGVKTGFELLAGEVMHLESGQYGEKIEKILRGEGLF